jgi:hypothetical protein
MMQQGVGWELKPGNPTLEIIYDPQVMAEAQKVLMEQQAGPLTHISSTQGFFPYKVRSVIEVAITLG